MDRDEYGKGMKLYGFRLQKEKRRAYLLKSEWGAKLSPFVALYEDNVMKKGFYSEDDKDVINTLINYLNNESKN